MEVLRHYCFQECAQIFLIYSDFSWGLNIPTFLKLLAIFSDLKFSLKFAFTISVTGVVNNVNVGYASITTGIYVDRIVCLKVKAHWLITSSTTYRQLRGI